MPEPVIQEGTLNEDRVEFGWLPSLVAEVCRVFAAEGADEEGHFRDVENPPARAD
jgi:hypothetical protein